MSFEPNLRRVARDLPEEPVPATLQARVLNALPTDVRTKNTRRIFLSRLAFAGIAATTIGVGVLLAPQALKKSYAAKVQEAIQKARTWHFTGWRLKDGKKVQWEIWGQRTPFLYREQIGDEILLDDGKRRIHILPPDVYLKTPGTYLVTPSEQLRTTLSASAKGVKINAGFLAGIGSENSAIKTLNPVSGNAKLLRGEAVTLFGTVPPIRERAVLEVDGNTHLPTRYTVSHEIYGKVNQAPVDNPFNKKPEQITTVAELTPEYDTDLPPNIATVSAPAGYRVVDTSRAKTATDNSTTCTRKGVTIRGEVVGQDSEGNLRLRFEGWLGEEANRQQAPGLGLMIQAENGSELIDVDGKRQLFPVNRDDAGNAYVEFYLPPWTSLDTEHPELWLTPVEPVAPNAGAKSIHVRVNAALSRYERMGNSGRTVPVVEDVFTFDLLLPAKKTPLGWDELPNSHGMRFRGVRPTSRMEMAEKRGLYYMSRSNFTPSDKARGEYWFSVVADEAKRTNNHLMAGLAERNLESLRAR